MWINDVQYIHSTSNGTMNQLANGIKNSCNDKINSNLDGIWSVGLHFFSFYVCNNVPALSCLDCALLDFRIASGSPIGNRNTLHHQ